MTGERDSFAEQTGEVVAIGSDKVQPYNEARAQVIAEFERGYLRGLYERCHGNVSKAARLANMDRSYLITLLRRHGVRYSGA